MKTFNFLSQFNFADIIKSKYEFEDCVLPYYLCSRTVRGGTTRPFAKYIIIDLCDTEIFYICKNTILSSYKSFCDFQETYISPLFFHDDDIIRYNIYLLFIYTEYDNELYDKICNDLNFARKIFLRKDEFDNYFNFTKCISEIIDENNKNDLNSIDAIEKIVKKLHSKKLKCLLRNIEREKLFSCFDNNKKINNLDLYLLKDISDKKFFEDNFYKEVPAKKTKDFQVKRIKNIKMMHFRENCFNSEESIQIGDVNVFYGENAIGKSSILDAVEFAFTGQTHKYLDDVSLANSVVTIIDSNDKQVSSNDIKGKSEEYKKIWYKHKMGTLNELFCRINYFDTDATYRFALEEGNADDAFVHLKKLLCNGRLIDIENNLIRNMRLLSFAEEIFRIRIKRIPKVKFRDKRVSLSIWERMVKIFSSQHKKNFLLNSEIQIYKQQIDIANVAEDICKICEETLESIAIIMHTQIELSLKLINEIFHRLYSYDSSIDWHNETFELNSKKEEKKYTIKTMSTAQKVCLALSVIFAQFFSAKDAPRIIMLDESVANFDSLHLLNLFDFLRDAALDDIQIFFTTASEDVAMISKNKFKFLGHNFNLYKLDKNQDSKAKITKIN